MEPDTNTPSLNRLSMEKKPIMGGGGVSWVSMMLDLDAGEEEENLLWQCACAGLQVTL